MKKVEVFYDGGKVSKDLIVGFAKKNNFLFPCLYVDLISEHNELFPKRDYFDFFDKNGNKNSRDVSFFGYGGECENPIENWQDFDVYER